MGNGTPGGSADSLRRRTGTENLKISESQLRLFFGHVSPEEQERHAKMRRDAANNIMIESAERNVELAEISSELGIEEEGGEVLSEDEKNALRSAIRSYRETENSTVDYGEMCQGFMRSLRARSLFKAKFKQWESEFSKEQPEIAGRENFRNTGEFRLFIQERGVAFIKENRRLIVEDSVEALVINNEEEVQGEDRRKEKVATLSSAINDFIDQNGSDILSDDKTVNEETYKKFQQLMMDKGYDNIDEAKIKAFFDKMVITVAFEYLSVEEYRVLSGKMIDNVDEPMSDERWEEMLNRAAQDRYNELEEAVSEATNTSNFGNYTGSIITADGSFSSIEELGSARGVVLKRVPGSDTDYYVDSDQITDKNYMPILRMGDNNDFYMQIVFPDQTAGQYDGALIDGRPSKRYGYASLQEAINRQLLDYKLNTVSRLSQVASGRENPNELLYDARMQELAERLFGFRLNEKQLTKDQLNRFGRMCLILSREGEMKVRDFLVFLNNRNNAETVWQLLSTQGSTSYSLDSLTRMAQEVRMGKSRLVNRGIRI